MAEIHDLNLATHRAPESVWDKRGWDGSRDPMTVGRWLLAAGAGALVLQGARRRDLSGGLLAGVGVGLAWCAFGDGNLRTARCWGDRLVQRLRNGADDLIHEASADSFPASDAPSWTPTAGTGTRPRAAQ